LKISRLSACVLIEAHDEWQDQDRHYLSEESMALLNSPEPTILEPEKTSSTKTRRKEITAATQ
jgi:putative transposase